MSSRVPGAGDLYGLAGGGSTFSYMAASSTAKRPISEVEQQQQQLLLLRSVRAKMMMGVHQHQQQQQQYHLQASPLELQSAASFAFHKQQQLLQQRHAVASHLKSRLEELEKHLLLDDDPALLDPHPPLSSSEWSHTLLLSSSPSPPSPSPSSSASTSSPSPSPPPKKLLLDAASAMADGHADAAAATLSALNRASARADPEQRLCTYLAAALLSRLNNATPSSSSSLSSGEHLMGTQLLHEASPCFKLAFLAANLALSDAARSLPSLHVLDFDVGNGGHYAALLTSLSSSATPLKITAVSDPHNPYTTNTSATHVVKSAGERLADLAKKAGVPFRFHSVSLRCSDLTRHALGLDPDEPLAVNLAFLLHKVPDESVTPANPRDELLRRVKFLNPKVVVVVEHEMNGNTTPFLPRLSDALAYHSALFDSLDATMGSAKDPSPAAAAARARIEDCLGRKAANAVACEGSDRVERCEVFGKWRARMGMAGFRPRALPGGAADALRSRLAAPGRAAFTVGEDAGGLCFGYSGRTLTVTSTWQ